ncbi:MAG: hypothetical protein HPY59_04750 [Anaerolineae bacterium]|nr:hypothetical protein [Anaerolineae bacterium]
MAGNVDLVKIFQTVTKNLAQNQDALNRADSYNHDHGDNVVQVFNLITKAVKAKKEAEVSDQLAYASEYLSKNNHSGSGQAYAQGLARAASQFKGQTLSPENSMGLINALLGAGQAAGSDQPTSPADLLGALLGGGGQAPAQSASAAGDLLGALLGGGDQSQNQSKEGMDTSQLLAMGLNIGMNFLEAKKQGHTNMEALVQSLVAGSQMGQTPHRAQSASIVASTLMSLLTAGSK